MKSDHLKQQGIGIRGGLVKRYVRPWLREEFLSNNVTLEIDMEKGIFRVPHDELHAWVGEHKSALETPFWLDNGFYHWSKTPQDMLDFLEQYRVST